jgi:hypothetical protein
MDILFEAPWSYLLEVPWPYWLMACVAVLTSVLTINSNGDSLCLDDCPHCGEPLGTNYSLCETCSYEEAADRQGFSL